MWDSLKAVMGIEDIPSIALDKKDHTRLGLRTESPPTTEPIDKVRKNHNTEKLFVPMSEVEIRRHSFSHDKEKIQRLRLKYV